MVCRHRRLRHRQVRHEPRRARPRRGAASRGIAVNALWPRTTIATAAIRNVLGGEAVVRMSRTPDIVADAAHLVFEQPAGFTGHFLIDDSFLYDVGGVPTSRATASCRARSLRRISSVPDAPPPPPGVTVATNLKLG